MEDFSGSYAPQSPDLSYAPQSPDLSEIHSYEKPPNDFPDTYYSPPNQPYAQQPYLHQPTNHDQTALGYAPNQLPNSYHSPIMPKNGQTKTRPDADDDFAPEATAKCGSGRKSKKAKFEEEHECDIPAPGIEQGIEVKTKFPVARIKRIMQADEDVGKVAQVTPTAVSKALELFMISLVTKSANEARQKSSKRVTAVHLKQAVQNDNQFDFLSDIVQKIPDAPAPRKKEETPDSEEATENRKRKRGATRRKKKSDDDDF